MLQCRTEGAQEFVNRLTDDREYRGNVNRQNLN
jgi:hypothetical protein